MDYCCNGNPKPNGFKCRLVLTKTKGKKGEKSKYRLLVLFQK